MGNMKYLQRANASLETSEQLNEPGLRNEERFQSLIESWEKQTGRLDKTISEHEENEKTLESGDQCDYSAEKITGTHQLCPVL